VEQFVRVVHRRAVAIVVEHVVVEHAVRLGMQPGGHGEVVDERLRGKRGAHVRRRGGRVPEPGQVRRRVGPDVVGAETVERQHDRRRVSRDRRRQRHRQRHRDNVNDRDDGRKHRGRTKVVRTWSATAVRRCYLVTSRRNGGVWRAARADRSVHGEKLFGTGDALCAARERREDEWCVCVCDGEQVVGS